MFEEYLIFFNEFNKIIIFLLINYIYIYIKDFDYINLLYYIYYTLYFY